MNHTGGFFYHYLALRNSGRRWMPYQAKMSQLLSKIPVKPSEHLILVGPSGGYSLSREFLMKFKSITVFEPDSMGKSIFYWRLNLKNVRWIPSKFDSSQIQSSRDETTILFCNCLGQMKFQYFDDPKKTIPAIQSNLREAKSKAYRVLSYHDLYSFPSFKGVFPSEFSVTSSNGDIIRKVMAASDAEEVSLVDHYTNFLVKDNIILDRMIWDLGKRTKHIIDFMELQ
ncbi:MAG: hypothetical protein AB8E15_06065 [Bdellovibrionales bacterium]